MCMEGGGGGVRGRRSPFSSYQRERSVPTFCSVFRSGNIDLPRVFCNKKEYLSIDNKHTANCAGRIVTCDAVNLYTREELNERKGNVMYTTRYFLFLSINDFKQRQNVCRKKTSKLAKEL